MFKRAGILLTIAFIFLGAGCQQAKVQRQKFQGSNPAANASESAAAVIDKNDNSPAVKPIAGVYQGNSSKGGCQFDFKVDVSGAAVKGEGSGTGKGDIACIVTLDGAADSQGKLSGQAAGTYTLEVRGQTFKWFLSGPFDGTLDNNGGGSLTIELQGTGYECPPNIPCNNESDTIAVTLTKT